MRLRYRASGGFAGTVRGVDLDTTGLAPAEARELLRLLGQARAAAAPAPAARGCDRIEHRLEVEDPEGDGSWSLCTDAPGSDLAPLLGWLARRSRPCAPD